MQADTLQVAWFEGLEEGYLVAFAGDSGAKRAAVRVILALDPWQRVWLADEGAWWISDDAISLVARRVPAIEEALARWHAAPPPPFGMDGTGSKDGKGGTESMGGSGSSSGKRRGAEARLHIALVPPAVAAAYVVLGLTPGADSQAVKAARRKLAQRCHPDAGGTHAAMAAINAAADKVMQWLVAQQRARQA